MDKRMFHRAVYLAVAIVLVISSTASVAHASNLCVHPGGAGGCYTTIQAAVDAASDGDEIVIRPGRYAEQVTIVDKNLTLIGREGAVIQAFPGMEATLSEAIEGYPGHPIIGVANADVTIRGVTIDGANLAEGNLFLDGIDLINAGGEIRDNVIKNVGFGEPTLPLDPDGNPILQGDGIFVLNFSATPRTVTIVGNRLVNFNNNGMTLISVANAETPDVANLTLHVARNTVIGAGPTDVIDQFGIFVLSDLFADPSLYATVNIHDNHIRDFVTLDPYPLPGSGIVTVNTNSLNVSNNEVQQVNVAVEADLTYNSQIWGNHLSGTGMDSSGTVGIRVSGSDIQISKNRIRKFETGISLHAVHPFFGPAGAFNTSLNDNVFQNVGVEIMTGPDLSSPETAAALPASAKFQSYRLRVQP